MTKKESTIKGKAFVVTEKNSTDLIPDIDTDMIFHNRYLAITDINEMGQYSFDNLEGYMDYAKADHEGEILIVGENFGSGSSRQQAVDCFRALGNKLILGSSFGAIYERNAINSGMPILWCEELVGNISTGDEIEVNLETGKITVNNNNNSKEITGKPFSQVQMDIYQAGDLFKYGEISG